MRLFAVFLGGPVAAGRMGEDHEVVFVVAASPTEAKERGKAKWSELGQGHVDAVQRVDRIDGYAVALEAVAGASGDQTELHGYN